MAEKVAYSQAVNTGKYERPNGLWGKYDNVRRFWENQVTGMLLRPALNELVKGKRRRLERLRVADLGCGSGDGYDLLMCINSHDPGICDYMTQTITPDMLQQYVGMDVNEDLLSQANEVHGGNPKSNFVCGDFSRGLPPVLAQAEPFDLYYNAYATLSHLHDDQCVKLFADVCRHANDGALLVGDWLGRYSVEWQDLWHHPADQEYFMDYRMSYIYPEEERDRMEVASFPYRVMTKDEVMAIVDRAGDQAGVELKPLGFLDRSILVGRHTVTGEYNTHCPQLRIPINSLFEGYMRTDLDSLLADYVPRPGFDLLNNFFEMFFMCTNTLVRYTRELLENYDFDARRLGPMPEVQPNLPKPLTEAMETMRRVVEGVGWVQWGDVRANVIEPVLGYSLRKLELELQPGTGVGHGLVGLFRVGKS
jgi:SAM-dependent methyltransferase